MHLKSGSVFALSMSGMAASGVLLAVTTMHWFLIITGVLALYLVLSGWRAVRHRQRTTGVPEIISLLTSLSVALLAVGLGLAGSIQNIAFSEVPATVYLGIGMEAALFAWIDWRKIRAGGFQARHRMADHVWRMIMALAFATTALLVANNEFLPESLRQPVFTYTPVLFLYIVMFYWLAGILYDPARASAQSPDAITKS